MDDSEGAHRWMQVFDELRARGVEDVLYVSSDGVAGLGEGCHHAGWSQVRN